MKQCRKYLSMLLVCMTAALLSVTALAADVMLSPQKLTADGQTINCEKYLIDGRNYFKLRDLACVLNGTGSQFSVGWDPDSATVRIVTGEAYVSNGSELITGEDKSASAQPSAQTIMINGTVRSDLTVYTIGGNNFFQLRELGTALGFDVDYNGDTNTAIISSRTSASEQPVATIYERLIPGETFLTQWHDPKDMTAVENNIRYMLQHGMNTISMTKTVAIDEKGDDLNAITFGYTDSYLTAIKHFEEFGYNNVSVRASSSVSGYLSPETVTVTITFSNSRFSDEELKQYQERAFSAAVDLHDQLWSTGAITEKMTQKEKARVYYDWIVKHCEYNYAAPSNPVDFGTAWTAYGALCEGKAVCEGYTGAYNLLLKLEGISCSTEMTDDHIWTTATLDGVFCHIDATWGDQNNMPADRYFAMTPEFSWARFS